MYSLPSATALLTAALLPLTTLAQAPVAKCNAAPKVNSTRVAYQFTTPGAWIENMHARKNGSLLVTRLDVPEVHQIDPRTGYASLIAKLPYSQSVMGITDYKPDVFAVVAGNISQTVPNAGKGSWNVWSIDMTGPTAKVEKIVNLGDEAKLPNGVTTLSSKDGVLLIADSQAGKIWSVDMVKKSVKTFLADATTANDAKNPASVGVNGIHFYKGTLYYSNSFQNTITRTSINRKDLSASGQVQNFAKNLTFADDFTFDRAGDIFIALNSANQLAYVPNCGGASTTLVGSDVLMGPTAVVYGRRADSKAKTAKAYGVLYISTAMGKLIEVKLA